MYHLTDLVSLSKINISIHQHSVVSVANTVSDSKQQLAIFGQNLDIISRKANLKNTNTNC